MKTSFLNISFFIIVSAGLLTIYSCNHRTFDTKEELISYMINPKNGMFQSKIINKVEYAITLRPTDLMAYNENEIGYSQQDLDAIRKKYQDFIYVNLSISREGKDILSTHKGDRADYLNKVRQMVFGMGDKIHFITKSRDTLPLLDYIYPRTYGMGNNSTMVLVFDRDVKLFDADYCFLTIEDFGLSTGEVSFKIPTKSFLDEPKLRFR